MDIACDRTSTHRPLDDGAVVVMNDFEERTIRALERSGAQSDCLPLDFRAIEGEDEEYLYAKTICDDEVIEVYIYQNAAGWMMREREWTGFEPDLVGDLFDADVLDAA